MSKPTNITWHETSISKENRREKMGMVAVLFGLLDSQGLVNQLSQMQFLTNYSAAGSVNMFSMETIFATD
jgi:hypothetical protein